jgi:hypothetical protein
VNLLDAVTSLAKLDPDATIYVAEPWHPAADTLVVQEPPDGRPPEAATREKLTYFLEVRLAQEIADDWRRLDGSQDVLETCRRLISYAKNDA